MRDNVAEYSVSDGVRIVTFEGEIDIANAGALEERLLAAAEGARALVLTLDNCSYIDSSGLRVLIRLSTEIGDRFTVVVAPGTQIRRIVSIAGIDLQVSIADSLRDALARARTTAG